MLLTLFYMVATWVQSWRLSSLRTRLQSILQGPENTRPTIMLHTAAQLPVKEENNGNKNKLLNGNHINNKDMLSSHFCNNNNLAKLGDLLWYQGDKRLCTIYPQQKVDVSDWLLFPYGKTVFPLFTHNNAHPPLQDNVRMHVLIEADLNTYFPQASSKATKLEDYGLIVTWTSDESFGVILETDLDLMTKFSTTLMQGQCFINNGLPVTRIESVSVSGKPCECNHECFDTVESKKLISGLQWDTYIKKLKLVGSTSRLVSQQNQPMEVKEIPGLIVSPGRQTISLKVPDFLEMTILNNAPEILQVPSPPPPTPVSVIIRDTPSRLSQVLTNSVDLNSSVGSLSNLSSARSQEFLLEETSAENLVSSTPLKAVKNLRFGSNDTVLSSSMASSRTSLVTNATNYSPSKKSEIDSNKNVKPPNILICADSAVASDNVRNVLETTLKENKYTIYPLSAKQTQSDTWMDQTNLLIVCGNVGSDVSYQVVEYLVRGGKLLALCSDILTTFLPTFKTAEVRENELVRFSYGKWKHVWMMHHVFCYQASPVKTKFSHDLDDSKSATPPTPVSANVSDRAGKAHAFDVKILGTEETWHTPSILLAKMAESGGRAVFSQIHLEADPSTWEFEENKFAALKQSNVTRLEIFADLLGTHLGVEISPKPKTPPTYCSAFFLGRHDLKLEMLKQLKDKMQPNDVLKTNKIELQFCGTSTHPKPASSTFLPIMVHRCPDNFSTVEYFENLSTEAIGRLVIYSDIMTSSNDVVNGVTLHHGLAVIPFRQTKGRGRSNNTWISPDGCAMFTVQLHIPLNSQLGDRLSLIQHLTAVSIVMAVKSIPGYEKLDIKIKWPNDIYEGGGSKIGGLNISCSTQSPNVICDIGVGINLSNSSPTTCINDLIKKYNEVFKTKLKQLTYEKFIALVFNEMEKLINIVQIGNLDYFYNLYYKLWIHTNAEVTVILPDGSSQEVKILGIDDYGFLKVKGKHGNIWTVHPDGNSFDIMKGLIAPKT